MKEHTEEHTEYLNKVIAKKPVYKGVLNLYLKILEEQNKTKLEEKNIVYQVDTAEVIKEKLRNGFPIIVRQKLKVNLTTSVELFFRLSGIFEDSAEIKNIEKAFLENREKLSKLLEKIFLGEEDFVINEIKNAGLNSELFIFLARLSIQPLGKVLSSQLKNFVDEKLWLQGYCPICGGKPNIAELRGEEGKKYLHCSFCSYEWLYKRLSCPFCNNDDHQTLGYFYAENEEGYRIDICDKCKKYIKTIDSRKLNQPTCLAGGRVNLEIEDWCTLHLDLIAKEKNYQKEKTTLLVLT